MNIDLHSFAASVAKMRELQQSPNGFTPKVKENRKRLEMQVDATCREILKSSPHDESRQTLDEHTEMKGAE